MKKRYREQLNPAFFEPPISELPFGDEDEPAFIGGKEVRLQELRDSSMSEEEENARYAQVSAITGIPVEKLRAVVRGEDSF